MDWAGKEQFYEQLKAVGKLNPEDVVPELGAESMILGVFYEACTCRPVSMGGVMPLSAQTIWQFVDRYELGEQADWVLRELDNEYLRIVNVNAG